MKKLPFRQYHLLQVLQEYDSKKTAFDRLLSNYFFTHKSLGSHDRKYLYETAYAIIRNKGLIDSFLTSPVTWEKRLSWYEKEDLNKYLKDTSIPLPIRLSFPKYFFNLLINSYGEKKTKNILSALNTEAPITIRANGTKITREALFEKLKDRFEIKKCIQSPYGITFLKRYSLFSLQEFKDGLFEMQDEASQLAAEKVAPMKGERVLDYCSGSGGKALAIAAKMQNTGQIFLHDIRKSVLYEARKRMKRAGIQNYQLLFPEEIKKKLKLKMDWVLLDVPCSGSGTLRRCPEMKWKWTKEAFEKQLELQRTIFKEGLSYLKKGGFIVYATCSIFEEENEKQIEYFLSQHPLVLTDTFKALPQNGEMDGFYAAVFQYQP
jgi:16S rRNA C967 or C1407 C5-methylase (RsmB/RsmF family)